MLSKPKIVCLNWGKKYSPIYVDRLYNMVSRHLPYDFDFFCLTDNPANYGKKIQPVQIKDGLEGWWNKMSLFRPGTLADGEYLYFDLDVVLVSDISDLWFHEGFGISRDFVRPNNGLLGGKEYNSSVMKFTQNKDLWTFFENNQSLWREAQQQVPYFGDQNVISAFLNHHCFSNPFPDEWIWSYKAGVKRGSFWGEQFLGSDIPKDGKICVFHGQPNPSDIKSGWVAEHWC